MKIFGAIVAFVVLFAGVMAIYAMGFQDGYSRGYQAHEIKSLSGKWAPLPKPRADQLPRVKI